MSRRAFTLVEILVACAIFLVLITMSASFFGQLTRNADRTLATIDLYHKANMITRQLRDDFSHSLSSCAMNYYAAEGPGYVIGDPEHITFMRSLLRTYTIAFNSLDNSAVTDANYDLAWIRWQWDSRGRLWRGQTRAPFHGERNNGRTNLANDHWSADIDDAGFVSYPEQWGRWATPVREFKYFMPVREPEYQLYTLGVINTHTNGTPRIEYPLLPEINVPYGLKPGTVEYPISGQRMQRGIWALHNGTDQRSTNGREGQAIPGAYVGVNPDGLTFNKNYMNLVGLPYGHDNYREYPSQMSLISKGIEYPEFSLIMSDGHIIDGADNSSSGSNNGAIPGISLDGMDLNGRVDHALPLFLCFSALVHRGRYYESDVGDVDDDGNYDENHLDAIHDLLVDPDNADRDDFDDDGDVAETWLQAIRSLLNDGRSGPATVLDRRKAVACVLDRERIPYIEHRISVRMAY